MAKLSLLIVLLIVGVGFISCTRNHDSDLEQYLNEEHEEEEEGDDELEDEPEDSNEIDSNNNQVETQIEAPPSLSTNTAQFAKNKAMKDFDTLMNNEAMRTSLQNISDKLKQFFYEIKTREAMKNIMKNVNMLQTIPGVDELIQKTIETWSTIIEHKDSKEIIGQMKQLYQVVSEDPKMGETISIIKEAVHTVRNNNASMTILRGGIKILLKLREQKQVHGIIVDTMRILGHYEKTNFALTTVMRTAPYFGTLQHMMSAIQPAQIDPEPQQKPLTRSLSARPGTPARKISLRMRVDNN